ncbi:MAG: WD40 domain-containing protein [Terriglobus roseus]|nr:WD40 domain-containing protein [Terriglobus roseus]
MCGDCVSQCATNRVEGTNLFQHRLLFGTNTSGSAPNYVQIASLEIPDLYHEDPDPSNYNDQTGEVGDYGAAKQPFTFKIIQKINHPGEVNKARYMPQNPNLIATMCPDGRILVFDRTKHEMTPKTSEVKCEMELVGHEKEGFAMSWSWANQGKLVTGAEDSTVREWDTQAGFTKGDRRQEPAGTWRHHAACVNDVQHHPTHAFWVGTVSDDLTLQIVDTRTGRANDNLVQRHAHADAVNALAFHPKHDPLVATASADRTVALWDLRNIKEKVHSFEGHRGSVIKLEFHPQRAHILASGSYDRRILIWNLADIGEEQTEEEAEDGPPEL